MKINKAEDIGMLIRERRKEMNMTQKGAAELCGVGVRFLSELERGKPTLEIDKVLSVASAFGFDVTATLKDESSGL